MFLRQFAREESGGPALEFALVIWAVLLLTLGIVEFGYAMFQWNNAEKAAQLGVRLAVSRDPVASDLVAFSGKTAASSWGEPCMDPATGTIAASCIYAPNPVVCTSTGCNGYNYSANAFNAIVAQMQTFFPGIAPENVVIEYAATGLGFVGRPGDTPGEFNLVPAVKVRLVNMTFDFLILDDLLGLNSIPMPSFSSTLIGEDLDTTTS